MTRRLQGSSEISFALLASLAGCNDVIGIEPLPTGVPLDALISVGGEGCQQCIESTCTAELEACNASATCREAYECLRDSPLPIDPSDMWRCRIGDWGSLSREVLFCAEGCASCGLNEDMSCAGKWDYPAPGSGDDVDFQITLVHGGKAIPGGTVKTCTAFGLGCSSLAETTTDAAGRVSMSLKSGFAGFFEISADGYGLGPLYVYPHQEVVSWNASVPQGLATTEEVVSQLPAFSQGPALGLVQPSMATCFHPLQTSLPVTYSISEDAGSASPVIVGGFLYLTNLNPGFHQVTAEIPGQPPISRTVQVQAGITTAVRLVPR